MKQLYRAKFTITSKTDSISCFWDEVPYQILGWLRKKYGKKLIYNLIPDSKSLLCENALGDVDRLYIETAYFENEKEEWYKFWACRITEPPKAQRNCCPRRWITEIGVSPISEKELEVSYLVSIDDNHDCGGQEMPIPGFNLPGIASYILTASNWTCTVEGKKLDTTNSHRISNPGELFGICQCKAIAAGARQSNRDMDKRWISLCKVNRPDKNNNIWMRRLADSINGCLVYPDFDENKEQIFDNRLFLFHENGPSTADTIGFWEWKERKSETDRWFSDSHYIDWATPTEIYVIDALSTVTEVMNSLRSGIHIPSYLQNSVIFAIQKDTTIEGVLCKMEDFISRPGNEVYIKLKSDIYTLPYYQFSENEIFTWKKRKICKQVQLDEATKKIPVVNLSDTIKQLFIESMQWPIFKAEGISKPTLQSVKQVIHAIPNCTIVEKISASYDLSIPEAQNCIDQFLQSVDDYIDVTDVDSTLVVQMLTSHSGLKETLYGIAAEKWHEDHIKEIQQANEEVSNIYSNAKQRLAKAEQDLLEVQKSVSEAKEQRQSVLDEISTARNQLSAIQAEIEKNIVLGNETVAAVRAKIAEAQKDMAGFIADLSIFMPQATAAPPSRNTANTWKYECAKDGLYSEDDIELAHTWDEEYNALSQNLTNSIRIEPTFGAMLAAFLYSAHINNIPLLVAGPGGAEIANALSVSLYAKDAGHLTLGNEYACDIIDEMKKNSEKVISIDNMFGKGWSDTLPQAFSQSNMQVIWTHPTVEDLAIEPKGLYNYMLPILSESFIGMLPAQTLWPGKRLQDDFKAFVSPTRKPLKLSAFKRLGLSKLIQNKLSLVLSDAKELLGTSSADKDIETLMGLLPLCVVTGRIDILRDVIESENGISSAVKAEAARYFEEE